MMSNPTAERNAITVAQALFAATSAPIALLDERGRCLQATAAFARALNSTADAMAGTLVTLPANAELQVVDFGAPPFWRLATLDLNRPDPIPGQLRRMFDEIPIAIGIKDAALRYLFMNRHLARQFGVTPDQSVGRTDPDLAGDTRGAHVRSRERDVIDNGRAPPLFEDQYAGVDGVIRDWLVALVPLHGDDGTVRGVASIALDISERKRLEDAMVVARRDAEEGAHLRTRFLTLVGSELRAPLNAVIGCSEFLVEQSLGPLGHATYAEFAQDILTAGRHLLELINDTLDMARIEAGRMVLDEEPLDLSRTIAHMMRMMALPARHKKLALTCEVAPGLPPLVADPRRLNQILGNLLSNAIKSTPSGGRVTVSAACDEAGDLVLAVADTGIGIAAADITTAMAPFGRIGSGNPGREDGTGLGLPLAKALVEGHGGRLELTSAVGRGTVVRAIFPGQRLRPV
ncbi:MAG: PAS domain-containing protein [Azospirillum sp.]|nr:PAS domain-containing protein [Azospirillum sp.]